MKKNYVIGNRSGQEKIVKSYRECFVFKSKTLPRRYTLFSSLPDTKGKKNIFKSDEKMLSKRKFHISRRFPVPDHHFGTGAGVRVVLNSWQDLRSSLYSFVGLAYFPDVPLFDDIRGHALLCLFLPLPRVPTVLQTQSKRPL